MLVAQFYVEVKSIYKDVLTLATMWVEIVISCDDCNRPSSQLFPSSMILPMVADRKWRVTIIATKLSFTFTKTLNNIPRYLRANLSIWDTTYQVL